MSAFHTSQSERLVLREFTDDDFEWIHPISADPDVVRFMEWGPNSEEDTRNYLESTLQQQQTASRQDYYLAVERKGHGPIGNCALHNISDTKNGEAEIGYTYGRTSWGQGFATEAAKMLTNFGFRQLNLHKIYAKCVVENSRSARVMEKLGMRREGRLREHRLVHGEWKDFYYYAILAHEWETDSKE